MKLELQDKIFKKYPEFFEHLKDYKEGDPIPTMAFGIECNDGWYWLLNNTLETIHDYCKWNNIPYPSIIQIKEKYGRLEIYHDGDNMIDGMIWLATHLSTKICEVCGSTENVGHTQGWIYTICEKCYNTENEYTNHKDLKFIKYE